jgi:hypothetical protein
MQSAETKFIEITTIKVGVLGVKSKQLRTLLNVRMIESVQECAHPEDAAVKTVIDMLPSEGRQTRHFLGEPFDEIAQLFKNATS